MATNTFDDMAEKAREYEAQAKKLRRKVKAAKEKAYADALAAYFPEVADMSSESDVRAFVGKLRRVYDAYVQRASAVRAADSADGVTGESSTARPADYGTGYRE